MALFTEAELRRIERKHAAGVSSTDMVDLVRAKGERFSEATLRKYVQLGLLPMSRRVGIRGRHRGSSGLYPVAIVRLVNEIKRALEAGATLDEIKLSPVALASEVQVLHRASERLMERFNEAIGQQERNRRVPLRRALDKHRQALSRQVRDLDKLALRIGKGGGGG